jgi:hypothetical protein
MRWLLVAVACAACYRDAAPPAPPPPPPRHARTAVDPLAFLPADAELVVSVDAAQLRGSALWQKVQPALTAKLGDMLAAFAAECGYDPIAAIKRVTLGISNARAPTPEAVIVLRGVDRDATLRCLEHHADPRVTVHAGIVAVRDGAAQMLLAFATAQTAVFVIGSAVTEDRVARIIEGGAPLRGVAKFQELYGLLPGNEALWFVATDAPRLFDQANGIGLVAMVGAVDISNGLAGTIRLRVAMPDIAITLVTMARAQAAAAKQIFEDFDVTGEGSDVIVRLAMTQSQLDAVLMMLGFVI